MNHMTNTPPALGDKPLAGRHLLIVEDSGALARALEERIQKLGGSSILIGSLPGVHRRYPRWKDDQRARAEARGVSVPLYDAIVTDYQLLGDGTGLDVVRWLQEQEGDLAPATILFTANSFTVHEDVAKLGQPITDFFVAVVEKTGHASKDLELVMGHLVSAIYVTDEKLRRYS